MERNGTKKVFLIFFVFVIFLSGCAPQVDKQGISEIAMEQNPIFRTDGIVSYGQDVLDAYNQNEWVDVIVTMKDESNITIQGSKEERRNLMMERIIWFEVRTKEVLSNLTREDFELKRKHSESFRGNLSKKGFQKIVQDKRIEAVYLNNVPPPRI